MREYEHSPSQPWRVTAHDAMEVARTDPMKFAVMAVGWVILGAFVLTSAAALLVYAIVAAAPIFG